MLLGEPPPTPLDFEFRLFRFPVRVSGLFWVLPIVFGIQMGHPFYILVWAIAIFTGVLIHELGHAFAYQYYGISPRIALTMMGGYVTQNQFDVWNLSESSYSNRSHKQQIVISAAGPVFGFVLAALIVGIVFLAGGWIDFHTVFGFLPYWFIELESGVLFEPDYPGLMDNPSNKDLIHELISASLFVNIYWGIMNLMPVYPLDGGNIARAIMMQNDPYNGLRNSLWLSVYAGAIVAFIGIFVLRRPFMGIMFGIFAFQSYQTIQRMDGKGFGPGPW